MELSKTEGQSHKKGVQASGMFSLPKHYMENYSLYSFIHPLSSPSCCLYKLLMAFMASRSIPAATCARVCVKSSVQ